MRFLGVERLRPSSLGNREHTLQLCSPRKVASHSEADRPYAGIISLPSRDDFFFLFFPYFRVRWVFVAVQTFLQLWRALLSLLHSTGPSGM